MVDNISYTFIPNDFYFILEIKIMFSKKSLDNGTPFKKCWVFFWQPIKLLNNHFGLIMFIFIFVFLKWVYFSF